MINFENGIQGTWKFFELNVNISQISFDDQINKEKNKKNVTHHQRTLVLIT